MKALPLLLTAVVLASPLAAFDFGGSLEANGSAKAAVDKLSKPTISPSETFRLWANWDLGSGASFLVKANASNSSTWDLAKKASANFTNTFTADLDYLVFSNDSWLIGRTDFRDFSNTVLSTRLDGLQWLLSSPKLDITVAAATSAGLFKSGSTIIISQDDLKDRLVDENFLNPKTLWASPRALGMLAFGFKQVSPDQNVDFTLLGQYDARLNVQKAGNTHDPLSKTETGAPVHMVYAGLGGDGRLAGTLYWNAWVYGGGGLSLTPVTSGTKQKWATSYIANAAANVDVTWLVPQASNFLANLSVQGGSWDDDGISPDQNAALKSDKTKPSLYTGWFGVSRTGGSIIYSPQLVNSVVAQLLLSVKPSSVVQIAASTFAFGRPTLGQTTESAIKPKSQDRYLGLEEDVSILLRPASDVGATLGLGVFVPNTSALSRTVETKVSAGLNLSF